MGGAGVTATTVERRRVLGETHATRRREEEEENKGKEHRREQETGGGVERAVHERSNVRQGVSGKSAVD